MAIAKARGAGLSAVALSNTSHVGRLADYAEMAAREGLVGMLWVNAVHGLRSAVWAGIDLVRVGGGGRAEASEGALGAPSIP